MLADYWWNLLVKLKFFSFPIGPELHQLSCLWMIKKRHRACLFIRKYIFLCLSNHIWVGIGGFYRLVVALKAGPPKEMVSWKVNWQKVPPGFGLPVLCNRWIVSSLYKCEFATLWVANKHCGTHPFVEGIGKWTYGQHLDRWGSFLLEVLSVESSWLHTQWGQWDLMPMPGGRSMNIRVSQKNTFFEFCLRGWTTGAD